MSRIATTVLVVLACLPMLASCASDNPRYADPPPGSHSPTAESDERQGDPLRDEGAEEQEDTTDQEGEEEEEEEPLPQQRP